MVFQDELAALISESNLYLAALPDEGAELTRLPHQHDGRKTLLIKSNVWPPWPPPFIDWKLHCSGVEGNRVTLERKESKGTGMQEISGTFVTEVELTSCHQVVCATLLTSLLLGKAVCVFFFQGYNASMLSACWPLFFYPFSCMT